MAGEGGEAKFLFLAKVMLSGIHLQLPVVMQQVRKRNLCTRIKEKTDPECLNL